MECPRTQVPLINSKLSHFLNEWVEKEKGKNLVIPKASWVFVTSICLLELLIKLYAPEYDKYFVSCPFFFLMKQSYNFDKDLDSIVKKKICAPLFMKNELLVPFSLLKVDEVYM